MIIFLPVGPVPGNELLLEIDRVKESWSMSGLVSLVGTWSNPISLSCSTAQLAAYKNKQDDVFIFSTYPVLT